LVFLFAANKKVFYASAAISVTRAVAIIFISREKVKFWMVFKSAWQSGFYRFSTEFILESDEISGPENRGFLQDKQKKIKRPLQQTAVFFSSFF